MSFVVVTVTLRAPQALNSVSDNLCPQEGSVFA